MRTDNQSFWIRPLRDGGSNRPSASSVLGVARTEPACQDRGNTLDTIMPAVPSGWRDLEIDAFNGGVALWGAVPAIYDTTRRPMQRGIHVHARSDVYGPKVIDQTFEGVRLRGGGLPVRGVHVSDNEAVHFMISSVFGFRPVNVTCSHCGSPHLDEGIDSVTPRVFRRCARCQRHFLCESAVIANPVSILQEQFGGLCDPPIEASRELVIRQEDFRGGIQIWGSNPAFFRTLRRPEQHGIHIHAFENADSEPVTDDTFSRVVVDGEILEADTVRLFMLQRVLPSTRGRIISSSCTNCGIQHVSRGRSAFTPQAKHRCEACGSDFIGNYIQKYPKPLSSDSV